MSTRTRLFAGLALAALVTAGLVPAAALVLGSAQAAPQAAPTAATDAVVFTRVQAPDGDQPDIEVGIWSPAEASPRLRPLIVISHGTGGDFRSHMATAQALARAGFVVAALTHTGDNWRDQSRSTDLAGRTRQVSALIEFMLTRWDGRAGIDPRRIGAFGYSAGGFTVLAAAGGRPDLTRMIDHCRTHPDNFDCRLVSQHAVPAGPAGGNPLAIPTDPRIRALVVAAPALGFTFAGRGLAAVTQPVQLWQAGSDQILPAPEYVEPVRAALPNPPEFFRVEGAGHFDFMPPCSTELKLFAPAICAPTPGFDRAAFHETFGREVIRFFKAHLAASSPDAAPVRAGGLSPGTGPAS